jgi:hypothetical protein
MSTNPKLPITRQRPTVHGVLACVVLAARLGGPSSQYARDGLSSGRLAEDSNLPAVYKTAGNRLWRTGPCCPCSSGRMGRPASTLLTGRVTAGGMTSGMTSSTSSQDVWWNRLMTDPTNYPEWFYYLSRTRPPDWVHELLEVIAAARPLIDSATVDGLTSDKVLAQLRPGLLKLGYEVEGGKHRAEKIRRPVLFGDQGRERVAYEVDAVHDELGILVEIEAGRGARGNAVYRDLVRSSLIVDQRFLVLGVMRSYRHQSSGRPIIVSSYRHSKDQLDALYASGRLRLPFEGVLLFGY